MLSLSSASHSLINLGKVQCSQWALKLGRGLDINDPHDHEIILRICENACNESHALNILLNYVVCEDA